MNTHNVLLIFTLLLSGCGYEATQSSRQASVEGCEIFKIKLQGEHHPLFLAKCRDTATVTYNTGGKSNTRVSAITDIAIQKEALEAKEAEIALKQNALTKLTGEERKALGLE